MQNELDIVRDVSTRLEQAGIAYMLTGSMAMNKEDLIISKLWWAKDSHSEQQLRDVKNLANTGCHADYIEHWTQELGLHNLWQECNR